MHYHADIVLMMFRLEKPGAQITLAAVENFDEDLHAANDAQIVAACEAEGIPPNKFERTRVLGLAVLSLGGAGKMRAAAKAYKKAVDEGIIG
jgi:hypothetical protein